MPHLKIKKMELGPIGTNAFLIWEDGGKEAVLVDAPPGSGDAVVPFLKKEKLVLSSIWLTHGHWDHMAGAFEMIDDEIPVLGHPADKIMFEDPNIMSSFAMPGIEFTPIKITQWLHDEDRLDLFGREVIVLHCPGHCPGNVVFWIKSENLCFVGDVIFAGGIGRYDLPGGDFKTLEKSITEKIYTLPANTLLCPGHGPDTKVGDEIHLNPFVQL